jgi:hypothetical protein
VGTGKKGLEENEKDGSWEASYIQYVFWNYLCDALQLQVQKGPLIIPMNVCSQFGQNLGLGGKIACSKSRQLVRRQQPHHIRCPYSGGSTTRYHKVATDVKLLWCSGQKYHMGWEALICNSYA